MKDIHQLLSEIEDLEDKELEDAIDQLTDFVKEFEGEEKLYPVEKALPSLCKYLIYDGPYIIPECMYSIFRRVTISVETIEEIVSLYSKSPDEGLISVLSNLNSSQWDEEIEDFVCAAMNKFPASSIYTLYSQSLGKLKSETLDLLYDLYLKREEIGQNHRLDKMSEAWLLWTICYQTHNENYEKATSLLKKLYPRLDSGFKKDIINVLSYFKNKGITIFRMAAKERDPELRLEVVRSLERMSSKPEEDIELLYKLSKDKNSQVERAANEVIKSLKNGGT